MASDPFPVGLVVWAKVSGWPWWPAVVVDRESTEPHVREVDRLAPESSRNRMVLFFSDGASAMVVDRNWLLEYTHNIEKITESDMEDKARVVAACQEANTYVFAAGFEGQRREVTSPAFMVLTEWKPAVLAKWQPTQRVAREHDVNAAEEEVEIDSGVCNCGGDARQSKRRRVAHAAVPASGDGEKKRLEEEVQSLKDRVAALERQIKKK